jgi:hypothetical protein
MKKNKLFKLLLPLLVLLQLNVVAQNDNNNDNDNNKKYEFTKTRSINKSYNVSASDKLDIDNSFGKVEVHTWEKNEIKVDVTIEVSASKEDLAQKIFDGITVSDAQSGKDISFKTKINGSGNNGGKGEKSTMRVNYNISMPASNSLHIENQFGATVLPDYRGEVDLVSKFGSLTTGSLPNVKRIDVEFGHASFENISNGNISIKYSNAGFGKVTGTVKLNLEFSTSVKMTMDNNLTGLDVKASYSTLSLKPVGDPPASYTILTSFGSFKNRTSIKFDGDDEDDDKGPKFDHKYSGKSGSGSIPVKVNSNFSNIILGEPAPGDMKEKNKSKSRTT